MQKEWLLKSGSGSMLGVLVVGLGVLAAGCGIQPKRDGGGAPIVSEGPDHAPSQEYRIGPEDVLEVVIWKNADLSKIVTVRPDGMITLPLIGELRAGGVAAQHVRGGIKTRVATRKHNM